MRTFFRIASGIIPSSSLVKGIGDNVISPFYHLVSDVPPPHVKHLYRVVSPKDFEKDLEFLLKHFEPIDAISLKEKLNRATKVVRPSLFLSFDDGFVETKEIIAPILLRKGIPATFFVNPAFVDNCDLMYRCKVSLIIDRIIALKSNKSSIIEVSKILNASDDLRAIKKKLLLVKHNQNELISAVADRINLDFTEYQKLVKPYLAIVDLQELNKLGFAIGGHGYNHPYFNEIPFGEQFQEVERCMTWISSNFPNQPKLFAFPFTDYGVSDDLIKSIILQQGKLCDLSFGTSGIQPVRFGRHLQRIPMEEKCNSRQRIVKGEVLYYLAKKGLRHYR